MWTQLPRGHRFLILLSGELLQERAGTDVTALPTPPPSPHSDELCSHLACISLWLFENRVSRAVGFLNCKDPAKSASVPGSGRVGRVS